jgi:hypothetical protein
MIVKGNHGPGVIVEPLIYEVEFVVTEIIPHIE